MIPSTIEVTRHKSSRGQLKCNLDGAPHGNPCPTAYGDLFRSGATMSCFSGYVGIVNSFGAEILGLMKLIEVYYQKLWRKLLLKCDSTIVLAA